MLCLHVRGFSTFELLVYNPDTLNRLGIHAGIAYNLMNYYIDTVGTSKEAQAPKNHLSSCFIIIIIG